MHKNAVWSSQAIWLVIVVEPIPLGIETDGVADAHVVVTPFVSTDASRVFLINLRTDVMELGHRSTLTGWGSCRRLNDASVRPPRSRPCSRTRRRCPPDR